MRTSIALCFLHPCSGPAIRAVHFCQLFASSINPDHRCRKQTCRERTGEVYLPPDSSNRGNSGLSFDLSFTGDRERSH